jgi:hypothetical protein
VCSSASESFIKLIAALPCLDVLLWLLVSLRSETAFIRYDVSTGCMRSCLKLHKMTGLVGSPAGQQQLLQSMGYCMLGRQCLYWSAVHVLTYLFYKIKGVHLPLTGFWQRVCKNAV